MNLYLSAYVEMYVNMYVLYVCMYVPELEEGVRICMCACTNLFVYVSVDVCEVHV